MIERFKKSNHRLGAGYLPRKTVSSRRWGRRLLVESLEARTLLTGSSGDDTSSVIDSPERSFSLNYSILRASDLSTYTSQELAATRQWVVGLEGGQTDAALASSVGAQSLGATGFIAETFYLRFPAQTDGSQAAAALAGASGIEFFYPLVPRQHQTRFVPNDPLFAQQWHLQNTGQTGGLTGADANVQSVWDTTQGSGVVIGIVDDGLQHTHPDLSPQYRPDLSRDVFDNDPDPAPDVRFDFHGTAVAGVAAGRGNNGVGISGAAPQAQLAGLRLINGPITDSQEATAISFQNQEIDIYNNSWGPVGFYVAPSPLMTAAFQSDVATGRGGLGNVLVWASGNGLELSEDANYDGYANSRYTIGVSAIDHSGRQSFYSEPGASILVAAYSGGAANAGIVTTDLVGTTGYAPHPGYQFNDYTNDFSGTSSATPLVSGVIALMLQANPNLSYRDVQHILVNSVRQNDPSDPGWSTNAAGRLVNHKYGFGAIDALAAVSLATTWNSVSPVLETGTPLINVGQSIPDNNSQGVTSTVDVTTEISIERVEIMVDATHPFRGDLEVILTSPNGTRSVLAEKHSLDSGDDLNQWVFTSVHHWGESSKGQWKIQVADRAARDVGTFNSFQINFVGTDPFEAVDDTAFTPAGTPVAINVLNNDLAQFSPLVPSSVTVVNGPTNGIATLNAATGAVNYTPNAIFFGTDTFTYTVDNQAGQTSNVATVDVIINNRPIAVADVATTPEETAVVINVLANDSDSDGTIVASTVAIVAQPAQGTVTINATTGAVTYTPNADFFGTDTFSYTVKDDDGATSLPGLVTVTVTPVNDPPIAIDDAADILEDQPIALNLLGNDIDPDGSLNPASIVFVSAPLHGSLVLDSATGLVTYTPDRNFFGSDSFTYQVSDGGGLVSNVATVTISVAEAPDPPVAVDDDATTLEDVAITLAILQNDSDSDGFIVPGSVTIVSAPLHGTLVLNAAAGTLLYTPALNFFGSDSFTYTIRDNENFVSNVATVDLTVTSVNDAPTAANDIVRTAVEAAAVVDVLANDVDVDSTIVLGSLTIVEQPLAGTAVANSDGTIQYTPALGYVGGDLIRYTIADEEGAVSSAGSVLIRVGDPVSVAGQIFVDTNNNGTRDTTEIGIAGVAVTIEKLDGPLVFSHTVTTAGDGSYAFEETDDVVLPAGVYQVVETHPGFFVDGIEKAGSPVPVGPIVDDKFGVLTLPAGQTASSYDFAERGLRAEFVAAFVGRRAFLASSPSNQSSFDLTRGEVWYAFDAGWSGSLLAKASHTGGAVNLTFFDDNLREVAGSHSVQGSTQVALAGTPGTRYFLKVSGTSTAANVVTELVGEVASRWQNSANPADVNGDGVLTAIDALLVINCLNSVGAGQMSTRAASPYFLDVNGDALVSPSDALAVINRLNTPASRSASEQVLRASADIPSLVESTLTAAGDGNSGADEIAFALAVDRAIGEMDERPAWESDYFAPPADERSDELLSGQSIDSRLIGSHGGSLDDDRAPVAAATAAEAENLDWDVLGPDWDLL